MTDGQPLHHDREYFERRFSGDDDPWGFDRRWYERRKYDLTLAALPRSRYRRAFEPGCANGALTERLAERCDAVLAVELLEEVADRARTRTARLPGVEVRCGAFPDVEPDHDVDLVVWSEVAYYLTDRGRDVAEAGLRRRLAPGGDLIAVHWSGPTDYPQAGSEVAEWIDGLSSLRRLVTHHDQHFELGVWRREDDHTDGAGPRQ